MADFMKSLWDSVFTPGPTPPLLLATNASFAALQAVLFALLIATYSVHFVVLGILCGALWWAINWFVAELRAAEELKRRNEREGETPRPADTGKDINEARREEPDRAISERDDDAEDEDGVDTETEGEEVESKASLLDPALVHDRSSDTAESPSMGSSGHLLPRPASSAASEASGVHVEGSSGDESGMRKRGSEMEMSGMTDSEWEKVSDAGGHESTS
ncbi:Pkr1-domain-containing protein [Rhizodiscina lignyota]|uniref:Pkr1-domain-containing protein n=1 Tax=Rhizodiscina lignyota TaxID=1504668 RepID=A0A9P4I425_9PEZI|nr:Pkr1-domain-containing protein [Rhizodiscina lignyota]